MAIKKLMTYKTKSNPATFNVLQVNLLYALINLS